MSIAFQPILTASAEELCNYENNKTILAKTADGYTALWTIPDEPALSKRFESSDTRYSDYVQWVRNHTSWSAQRNLQNQNEIARKFMVLLSFQDRFLANIENTESVIAGKLGVIRPMSCREGIAFREFLNVVDLRVRSGEFLVSVFKKGNTIKILGDFYGITPDSVRASSTHVEQKKQLVSLGWRLVDFCHNHPFDFANLSGDIGGAVVPSIPDIKTFRLFAPETATITNGIDTIVMQQSEYPKFRID